MHYKYVTFDLDDTLIDTQSQIKKAFIQLYEQVFQQMGQDSEREFLQKVHELCQQKEILALWKKTAFFQTIGETFKIQLTAKEIEKCKEIFSTSLITPPLQKGVREVLNYLKEQKITLGIISNCSTKRIVHSLAEHKIQEYFAIIISCKDLQIDKQSTEAFQYFVQHIKGSARDCIHIGDHILEDTAAKKVGFTVILYDYKKRYKKEQKKYDFRITSYTELLALLQKIKNRL